MAQAIFVVAALAATGIGAYSAIAQGQAAEDAAKYNAKVNENNARSAEYQAQAEAQQVRRRNAAILGRQRAVLSKSGVTLSGSAEDLMYDSAVQGELEALNVLYAGNVQSGYYQSRARLSRFEGANARTAGYYGAASSVLSGASSAASSYARYGTSYAPTF